MLRISVFAAGKRFCGKEDEAGNFEGRDQLFAEQYVTAPQHRSKSRRRVCQEQIIEHDTANILHLQCGAAVRDGQAFLKLAYAHKLCINLLDPDVEGHVMLNLLCRRARQHEGA
jgi:hypothetical protein